METAIFLVEISEGWPGLRVGSLYLYYSMVKLFCQSISQTPIKSLGLLGGYFEVLVKKMWKKFKNFLYFKHKTPLRITKDVI